MDIEDSMRRLDVTLYGNVETLTSTLSQCRVRIFYRGLNRNRTYIDDDFAQQLINSLPYAPVKGIFNKDDLDYKDHGQDNTDGRIYGVIAADPNFAWELHEDEDGVVREYACADVILFTALYPEARLVPGKSQSMEIHREGLTGEWKVLESDGKPYYHFQKGHLLGLQVLGDKVEPCFEGAAFFSLYEEAKDYYLKNSKEKEESKKMDKNLFRLSDKDKCELLWDAMNTSPDSYTVVCDIYDDYAIGYDCVNKKYVRAYYVKDNDANTVTINNVEDCYIIDVNEAEKMALDALKSLGTYSEIQSKIELTDSEMAKITAEYESNVAELQSQIAALTAEIETYKQTENQTEEPATEDVPTENSLENTESNESAVDQTAEIVSNYEAQLSEKDAEIARLNQLNSDITNEKLELENFKLSVEKEKKAAILGKFASSLTEDQVTEYTSKIDEYSVTDFEKELCYAAYQSNSSIIGKKEDSTDNELIWTGDGKSNEPGIITTLRKYKGGNK